MEHDDENIFSRLSGVCSLFYVKCVLLPFRCKHTSDIRKSIYVSLNQSYITENDLKLSKNMRRKMTLCFGKGIKIAQFLSQNNFVANK